MATYDSDSDEEFNDDGYTQTNVLLGYVSPTPSTDEISYIGGSPSWLDPVTPPSATLARCKVCRDIMVLLLQLNGELPDFPGHDRRLYILSCRRKSCRRKEGSVRAIRGIRITKESAREKTREVKSVEKKDSSGGVVTNTAFGDSLFGARPGTGGSGVNPFAAAGAKSPNPFATSQSNPFTAEGAAFPALSELAAKPAQKPATPAESSSPNLSQSFASALSLNNTQTQAAFGPVPPKEPWPQSSDLPEPYPKYYFDDVVNEQLDPSEDLPPQKVTMELDDESGTTSAPQQDEKDTYESTIDKTFQKFADRLAQNPEQVIRYEFKGLPLLYSRNDAVGKLFSPSNQNSKITTTSGSSRIPRCTNCGAGRVFEVQMTPHTILELESEEMGLDGMEWGTIIVGVCERDCATNGTAVGETSYLEEWAGVQWEELNDRRS